MIKSRFFILLGVAFFMAISFSACGDSVTSSNTNNIVNENAVPHPLPTSDSEEFPPKPPII